MLLSHAMDAGRDLQGTGLARGSESLGRNPSFIAGVCVTSCRAFTFFGLQFPNLHNRNYNLIILSVWDIENSQCRAVAICLYHNLYN